MPFTGITLKTGRVLIAAFGLICLTLSFQYFNPVSSAPQFAKLPRPPQGDIPEYPNVEDMNAAAEEHRPFKSSKSWFFGTAGDDAAVKSEEWFSPSATNATTSLDPSTRTKSHIEEASVVPSSSAGSELQTGSDAASFEVYVAPANVSAQQITPVTTEVAVSATTSDTRLSSVSEHASEALKTASTTSTPLVLYAYSPASWALSNLQFFLKHGLHGTATFVFIINGALVPDSDSDQSSSTFINNTEAAVVEVLNILEPYARKYPNIKIWKRPNTCYDLGAYAEVLKTDSSALLRAHGKFVLINASLRGPFVPFWSQECWSDAYLRLIDTRNTANSTHPGPVKLVGMTINCVDVRPSHIQSMILATDRVGIDILLGRSDESATGTIVSSNDTSGMTYTNIGIDSCPMTMDEAVNLEVSLTSLIQSHNYTVRAMMAEYWSKLDYELDCTNGDVNAAEGAYEGGNLGVFETLFIKTRWAVEAGQTERLTQWYNGAVDSGMSGGAWDKCGKGLTSVTRSRS